MQCGVCHRILSIQGTWAFLAALSYDGMPNLALLPSCLIIAACARQAGPPIAASALRWVSPPDKVSAANVAPPAAAAIITTHRPRPCRLPPPSVKPGIVCPFAQAHQVEKKKRHDPTRLPTTRKRTTTQAKPAAAAMARLNGAPYVTREREERASLEHADIRSRSVMGLRSDGFDELGAEAAWSSLDDTFPSQPRRLALSVATDRQATAKVLRGPMLRGPRTWMRQATATAALPEPVAELDRYYTGQQNPIGRSAGSGQWRASSERVVLAISQPPQTRWRDEQAGSELPAKKRQGSLLILKVSSGSVQNWRRVQKSATSKALSAPPSSQSQLRPVDMPTRAASKTAFPAVIDAPQEETVGLQHQEEAPAGREGLVHADGSVEAVGGRSSPTASSILQFADVHSGEISAHAPQGTNTPATSAALTRASSRSVLGSHQFSRSVLETSTNSGIRSRPLTDAPPTWRNAPSFESSGWYSRGLLIDNALDSRLPPALRHGRSHPAENSNYWRPQYGTVVSKSFPFRPPPPQASKLAWSRHPLAGVLSRCPLRHGRSL